MDLDIAHGVLPSSSDARDVFRSLVIAPGVCYPSSWLGHRNPQTEDETTYLHAAALSSNQSCPGRMAILAALPSIITSFDEKREQLHASLSWGGQGGGHASQLIASLRKWTGASASLLSTFHGGEGR